VILIPICRSEEEGEEEEEGGGGGGGGEQEGGREGEEGGGGGEREEEQEQEEDEEEGGGGGGEGAEEEGGGGGGEGGGGGGGKGEEEQEQEQDEEEVGGGGGEEEEEEEEEEEGEGEGEEGGEEGEEEEEEEDDDDERPTSFWLVVQYRAFCNIHLPATTTISLSSLFFKLMTYILREILISLCPSASVIRKSGSMALQSVKALPKYVNYKTVGSEISASALPSSKYTSLYMPCDFRIPGLESTETMGIFQITKKKIIITFLDRPF